MSMQRNIEKDMISKVRVPLLILFTCYFLISLSYSQSVELPCSKNGTTLFYINGMFNSDGEAQLSLSEVKNLYSRENEKKTIDSSGKTYFDYVYQQSLYKINSESTPLPDEVGAMSDLIEVAGQYIQDQIDLGERDDATFWQAMGSYYFKAGTTIAQVHPFLSAIEDLDRRYQGFFVEEFDDTVEEADLQRMMSNVRNRLVDDQMKMIIVSHSQGNFYANSLWNRLIRDRGIDKNYENYWGNMQLASPASYIAAKHGSHITAHQDKVMNSSYVLGNLASNIYFDSSYVGVDEDGHSFDLYLSSIVNGSYFSNQSISEPMESIFRSRMTDIAKSLAPNCGCDEEDYPLAVHENGGGLIGQFAEVSPLARVNSGATVCGESIVSNYVQLDAGTVVKDSELVAPFSTLDPDEITFELEGELPYHLVLENIEVNDSTIKGFIRSIRESSNVGKAKVLNGSLIDTQEFADQVLLMSNRYQDGFFNRILLGSNLEINNTNVFGSVRLRGSSDYRPIILNSTIENLVHYENEGHFSGTNIQNLRVGSHHIEGTSIIKTEPGLYRVNSFGQADETHYIRNTTLTNSNLVGPFKIDHLIATDSSLGGPLVASGFNRVEETQFFMSNQGRDNGDVSYISNVRLLASPFYNEELDGGGESCNYIRGPVDLSSLNSTCSNIFESIINGGDLYFSEIQAGAHNSIDLNLSRVQSLKDFQTNSLTANNYSSLNLKELSSFPSAVTVNKTKMSGKVELEDGHQLNNVILIGYGGEISLSSLASLNHVEISGGVSIEDNASIEHSIIYGNGTGAPTIIMNNADVSESTVRDSVLRDFSKVKNGSWVNNSELGSNSIVNASTVSSLSELRSLASVTDGSEVTHSIVESNVHVTHSDIAYVQLSSSVMEKDCRSLFSSYSTDYSCDELSSSLEYPLVQDLSEKFMWEDEFLLGIAPPSE